MARKTDIYEGAELYHVAGRGEWRYHTPSRAVVVDARPIRITTSRQGAFTFQSWQYDDSGDAILVDLHHGTRVEHGTPVRLRELRGPWKATLAKLGRTEAWVKGQWALQAEIAANPNGLIDGLLRLAAQSGMPDDTFRTIAQTTNH